MNPHVKANAQAKPCRCFILEELTEHSVQQLHLHLHLLRTSQHPGPHSTQFQFEAEGDEASTVEDLEESL